MNQNRLTLRLFAPLILCWQRIELVSNNSFQCVTLKLHGDTSLWFHSSSHCTLSLTSKSNPIKKPFPCRSYKDPLPCKLTSAPFWSSGPNYTMVLAPPLLKRCKDIITWTVPYSKQRKLSAFGSICLSIHSNSNTKEQTEHRCQQKERGNAEEVWLLTSVQLHSDHHKKNNTKKEQNTIANISSFTLKTIHGGTSEQVKKYCTTNAAAPSSTFSHPGILSTLAW